MDNKIEPEAGEGQELHTLMPAWASTGEVHERNRSGGEGDLNSTSVHAPSSLSSVRTAVTSWKEL